MIKFILTKLTELLRDKITWILLFAVSLSMALIVAIPTIYKAKAIGGHSMELSRLVPDFDYSTFFDFMRQAKSSFIPYYLIAFGMAFLYLLLNIFFAGGVIDRIENLNTKFSFTRFLGRSWKTFGKYLGVYVLMSLTAICVFFASGIFYFVASLLTTSGDDRSLVLIMLFPTAILVFALSFVVAVSDYAKVIIYKFPFVSFSSAFAKAFGFVFKKPKSLVYFWTIIALALLSMGCYLLLDKLIGMTGFFTIILFFVIQQLFSFFRIFLRFAHLGIASDFLDQNDFYIPEPVKPEPTIEEINPEEPESHTEEENTDFNEDESENAKL